jgi:hypothetical protein
MDRWATVGGVSYNIAQAPATKQMELLNMVGAAVLARYQQTGAQIDSNLLLGLLLVMPLEKFNSIASIVLYKTFQEGGKSAVTVGDFQNQPTNYYLLVAEGIKANLDDFFTYLTSSQSDESETETKA